MLSDLRIGDLVCWFELDFNFQGSFLVAKIVARDKNPRSYLGWSDQHKNNSTFEFPNAFKI